MLSNEKTKNIAKELSLLKLKSAEDDEEEVEKLDFSALLANVLEIFDLLGKKRKE